VWTGVYIGLHGGGMWSDSRSMSPFAGAFNTGIGQELSASPSGGLIGGHLGVNYQLRHFLIGAEVSFAGTNLKDGRIPANLLPTDRLTLDINDLLLVTGRLGVVVGQYLLYAKGGFASTAMDLNVASATLPVAANVTQRESGWTVGAGLEARIVSNLLFGLEYNYISLPNERLSSITAGAIPNVPIHLNLEDLHAHTVTARLSILFGPHACCSEGLLGKY
jgi:outer membrane immunogenic protein